MNRLLIVFFVVIIFSKCKNDDIKTPPELSSIVGKWRVVQYKRTRAGSTTIEAVPKENSWVYQFRSDGLILNERGYIPCCLASKFFLNGSEFVPEFANHAELDPICAMSLCASCPEMRITQTFSDSLSIETCPGNVTIFARETK